MADAPLTVTVTHMRESSGNEWWSAHLYRATGKTMAFTEGYEFYQSPIKGRVDYEADCMRKLLDPTLPDVDILAYDTDAPATPSPPVAAPPSTPVAREPSDIEIEALAKLHTKDFFSTKVLDYKAFARAIAHGFAAQPQPQPAQPLTGAQIEQKERFVVRGPGGGYVRTSLGVTLMDRESADQLSSVSGDYETVPVLVTITAPSTPTPPGDAPCSA